jgi:peptidoglycan/LPS O-acetylase OafA/YrhL
MASIVMAYGVVLAAVGFILQRAAGTTTQITFITGLIGGGLCVFWGIVALAGHRRRAWAILTLMAAGFVVLSQTVTAWMASTGEPSAGPFGRLLLTLLLPLTVGLLMYLLHGERPPEIYETGPGRRNDPPPRRIDSPRPEARPHPRVGQAR